MRALIIGRFQPFHKGHLKVIKEVSDEHEVIIGIGSAQHSHTLDNPFTAGERYEMIHAALTNEGIKQFHIIPIEDLNRYPLWVSHVESLVPRFDLVITSNYLTKMLFECRGYEVKTVPLYDREKFSGKEIRRRMIEGKRWKHLVPKDVVAFITRIEGERRLRELKECNKDD